MNSIQWGLVIIGAIGSFIFLMIILSHDINLQTQYVDNLHSKWLSSINNTSYCPDLKDWIDHDKDFYFKSDDYYKFVDKYQQFNCDEVLKK